MPEQIRTREESLDYIVRSIRKTTNYTPCPVSNGMIRAVVSGQFGRAELLAQLKGRRVPRPEQRLAMFFHLCERHVAELPPEHGRRTGLKAAREAAGIPEPTRAPSAA